MFASMTQTKIITHCLLYHLFLLTLFVLSGCILDVVPYTYCFLVRILFPQVTMLAL